jgi:hypothetical protein
MKPKTISIFVAGDQAKARDICARFCFSVGLCVTVTDTTYIYTGGREEGVEVKLQQYPLYPTVPVLLEDKARALGQILRDELYQRKVMIVSGDKVEVFGEP